METNAKFRKVWAEIVARAWTDEKFKKQLFAHPEEVFKEYGIQVKAGMHYKLIEETSKEVTLVFPHKPEGLSQEELKKVAGGIPLPGGHIVAPPKH